MRAQFFQAMGGRILATASALVSGVVALRLYGKYLDPESYGAVLIALQFLGYLPFIDGGFRTAINRRLLIQPDAVARAALCRFSQALYTWLTLIFMVVACIAMLVYAVTPAARHAAQPAVYFLTLALSMTFAFVTSTQINLLIGLGAQSNVFFLNALNYWVITVVLWLSLRNGAGLWALPFSTLAGIAGILPAGIWLIRRREPGFKLFDLHTGDFFWNCFRELKREAWDCFRSQVVVVLLFTVDVILVGILCGPRDAAVYGVLSRIFGIVRTFVQAGGEAAWPLVAQNNGAAGEFAMVLLRANSWLYGAVMGAIAFTLIPFVEWYMGPEWTAAPLVLYLLVARFFISGVSSMFGYLLYGMGRYDVLARYTMRELVAAVVVAVPSGYWFGLPGVCVGFLLSTALGSLFPLIFAYARLIGYSEKRLLIQLWWRALAAIAVSGLAAAALRQVAERGPMVVLAGLAGALAALAAAVAVGVLRWKLRRMTLAGPFTWREFLQQV